MTLTPREYEVARLVALGWTWDRITAELHISRDTLQKHRSAAMAKTDADSMPGVWAALGWLKVPIQTGMPGSGDSGEQPDAVESRGIDSPAVTSASLSRVA